MIPELSPLEARVVGSLIEKQLTTPQYYPLTLNALSAACNQTSNRHPVMSVEEGEVEQAVLTLKEKGLCRVVHAAHGRSVTRYRHVAGELWALEPEEVALLGVLLLRGPQTVGELRTRTERMAEFEGLDAVEKALARLADRPDPLVVRLDRQPGQKEARYAHLLCGEPPAVPAQPEAGPARVDRLAQLEERVATLEAQVAELRALLE